MEVYSEDQMDLPPGFRFHPTDEELITHYLSPKIYNKSFSAAAIGEVDLNKVEPWELPWKAKMGEKEWYFFCVRDRKYPTGLRTNRATESGYWKATGKDREIFKAKTLVGMKKTLVFYKGRAPRGEKTNWVMHEYRLEGKHSMDYPSKSAKNEWVISRVFHKSTGGIKSHISGLTRHGLYNQELQQISSLPPLLDISRSTTNQTENNKIQNKNNEESFNVSALQSSTSSFLSPQNTIPNPYFSSQVSLQFPECLSYQDQSILRYMMEYNGEETEVKQYKKSEFSQDTGGGLSTDISSVVSNHDMGQRSYKDQEYPITSCGPADLDCLWNY